MKLTLKKSIAFIGIFLAVIFGILLLKIGFEYSKINENSLNKSLLQNDTDGDGLSDRYEKKLFNPEASTFHYNKNISDLPLIEVTMASKPYLIIDEEVIETSTNTRESQQTSSAMRESTTTEKVNVSTSVSVGVSSTTSVSANASLTDFGVSGTESISTEFNATVEGGWESTNESKRASERTRSVSQSNSMGVQYTLKQGKFVCPVYVKNYGNLPASIKNMTLTALVTNKANVPVYYGTLKFDGKEFPSLSLDGNSDKVLLNFVDDNLFSEEIDLLKEIKGEMSLKIVSIQLSSPLVADYIKQRSLVKNKSVRLIFLDQNYQHDKILDVAIDDDNTLKDISELIGLKINYKNNWIYSINNDRADPEFDLMSWSVKQIGLRNGINYYAKYSLKIPKKLSEIKVNRGDVIYFFKEKESNTTQNYNTKMLKQLYYYNFSKKKEGIVDKISDDNGENIYTLKNVRFFRKNNETYNYPNYDITEEDIIKLYKNTLNQAIYKYYKENLSYGAQDPEQCYTSAVRRAKRKYQMDVWYRNYVKNNNLIFVGKNAKVEGIDLFRTEFYDYLINNEISYLHKEIQKAKITLKTNNSSNYKLHINDSKLKNVKTISINNNVIDRDSIKNNTLIAKKADVVELYCEYVSEGQPSTIIRQVEKFILE